MERRLAAIFAADVVGYSRLVGADEEGTIERFNEHRRQLIDPKIAEHQGRIVKTTGDGLLVEFASPVKAVRCAIEVQQGMADRNANLPQDRRIEFRIGINLCDVIVEDGDIYGDGVNVAARLEGIAEPGTIYISRALRDFVYDRPDIVLQDLGDRRSRTSPRRYRFSGLCWRVFRRVHCRPARPWYRTSRRSPCCRSRI